MKDSGVVAVDVQLSRNNGVTWETIANNITSNSYDWLVTPDSTSAGIIRVKDSYVPTRSDQSDATFAIYPGCCMAGRGNIDCSLDGAADIGDLTILVDHLFINFVPLCCSREADLDDNGSIDIGDLTLIVDHLFITFLQLDSCY
jgi:hypothetical protein